MVEVEWDDNIYLDCFLPTVRSDADVKLYWGGRDSGKSYHVALELIEKCLTADKFKCILIRKTFASIRDSQWELIKSIIYDLGLESLFEFTKAPLEIRCINGNSFIARGCDNPHNIKSVTEPTDAWYEEGDKLTYGEYSTVSTTLRSSDVRVQEWLTFNPESEGDYENHWLYKLVGKRYHGIQEFTRTITVNDKEIEINYISCHTDFNDNPYCPEERKAKYIATTSGDTYMYGVYIKGYWGNRQVKAPFAHQFDRKRHTSTKAVYDPNKIIYASIDFNIDPFTAIFFHIFRDQDGEHCHVFDEVEIQGGSIDTMAEQIRDRYGSHLHTIEITGDSMGLNKNITQSDNASLYTMLMRQLGISPRQFKVPSNPQHRTSRDDCNFFLFHFPDFKINPEKCPNLIRDLETVEVDMYGKIKKSNRQKEEQQADFLDDFRYMVNTFFGRWVKDHRDSGKGIPTQRSNQIDINSEVERLKL